MNKRFEIFLDTDIYLEHLSQPAALKGKERGDSYLIKCLNMFDCFTSVINASEIFAGCSTKSMQEKAKHAFYGSGVLGIPYKYSVRAGEVINRIKKKISTSASGIRC